MLSPFYHWLDESIQDSKKRLVKLSQKDHDTTYPTMSTEGYIKALQDVRKFFEPEIDDYEQF